MRRDPLEHDDQSLSAVPEIGVTCHLVELCLRRRWNEPETCAGGDVAERLGGNHGDVVTARSKRATDADERMDVTA